MAGGHSKMLNECQIKILPFKMMKLLSKLLFVHTEMPNLQKKNVSRHLTIVLVSVKNNNNKKTTFKTIQVKTSAAVYAGHLGKKNCFQN
jgi:hypothetical protein